MTNTSTFRFSAKSIAGLLKQSANDWFEDNALRLSAALAYYSIFSIAPLLIIAVAIAGWVFDQDTTRRLLHDQLQGLLGAQVAESVQGMMQSASKPGSSLTAAIVGTVTLLIGASGVFGQLQDALNTIWEVRAKAGQTAKNFIRERLLSFGMVLVIGFLLMVSLMMTTMLSASAKYLSSLLPISEGLVGVLGSLVSFAIIATLFAAIFKVLPDAKVRWADVWVGAVVTALLFEIGKVLLGLYLGREGASSAYGPAGAVVLVLLWVYYASLILLFGAEFTQVYAQARGFRIEPSENAEFVTKEQRAQEGLEPVAAKSLRQVGTRLPEPHRESPTVALGLSRSLIPPVSRQANESFAERNAFALLLAAIGGGYAIGKVARHHSPEPEDPVQDIKRGVMGLAAVAMTKGSESLSHLRQTGEDVIAPQVAKIPQSVSALRRVAKGLLSRLR